MKLLHEWIHTLKLQNLLEENNVQKLLFIKSNALTLGKDLLAIDWKGSEDNANDVESISSTYKSSSSIPNMIE